MKIYISGKITGNDKAEQQFKSAEERLIKQGHEVVNPFNLPHNHSKNWKDYMKEDIKAMMDCDAIFMLKGYKTSTGANLELSLARELGMLVFIHN